MSWVTPICMNCRSTLTGAVCILLRCSLPRISSEYHILGCQQHQDQQTNKMAQLLYTEAKRGVLPCVKCTGLQIRKRQLINWAPVGGKVQRLKRGLPDREPPQRSAFDIIYNVNQNAVQLPGHDFVSDLDIARPTSRSAGVCSNVICTWPKGPDGNVYIPYTKSSIYGLYDDIVFLSVFNEFADATCIRFIPRTTENDYITFESVNGCWSLIGRAGNQQFISLDKSGCMVTGVITHQLMQTLGFNHEHVRQDRDNYVAVQWANILNDYVDYFQMTDTNNMKYTPYDYGSILHFGKTAFSVDGVSQTLVPIPDSSVTIGQTFAMSDADIRKINLLYDCDQYLGSSVGTTTEVTVPRPNPTTAQTVSTTSTTSTATSTPTTPTTLTTTTTEAITIPKTTIITTSPTTTTTETSTTPTTTTTTTSVTTPSTTANRAACGGTLTAPSGEIISPNYPEQYPPSTSCLWTIIATTKVNITFIDFEVEGGQGCMFDFLKFDDMSPVPAYTPKYCGTVPPGTSVSFGGSVQVIFVSDRTVQMTGFKLHYTAE